MPRKATLPIVISATVERDVFDRLQRLAVAFGTDMISVFERELQIYLNQQVEQRLQLLVQFSKVEPTANDSTVVDTEPPLATTPAPRRKRQAAPQPTETAVNQ